MRTANGALLTGCAMDQFALAEYPPQHQYATAAAAAAVVADYNMHCGSNPSECEPAAAAYPLTAHHQAHHSAKDGGEYFASAEPYYYDSAAAGYCGGGYGGPYGDAYGDNWSSSPQEYSSSGGAMAVDGSHPYWTTPQDVGGPLQMTSLTLHPPPPPALMVPELTGFCDDDDFRSAGHGLMQFQPGRGAAADQTTCSTAAAAADQFFSKCTLHALL